MNVLLPNSLDSDGNIKFNHEFLVDILTRYVGDANPNVTASAAQLTNVTLAHLLNESFPTLYNVMHPTGQSSYLILLLHAIFTQLLPVLLGNSIFSAGVSIMAVTWIFTILKDWFTTYYYCFKNVFFYEMSIRSQDTSYVYLRQWLSKQNARSNHFSVHANFRDDDYDEDDKPDVMFVPGLGDHRFFYKNTIVWVTRSQDQADRYGRDNETMVITVFSLWGIFSSNSGKNMLRSIMNDAMDMYFAADTAQTTVYTMCDDYCGWERSCSRDLRDMSSVILPHEVKQDVVDDVRRFRANEKWYKSNCLIPKRGYLLYGAPGTGKTSFILAIAAEFKLAVCMLSLSHPSMTDNYLLKICNSMPADSILLMEDIDAAFADRKKGDGAASLTFSGLLNALDGVASQKSRIVFMTTNHIEKLSPALIRPGRVDYKIEFKLADKQQAHDLFVRFFPAIELRHIAEKLREVVADGVVSPAELQCLFIKNLHTPERIPDEFAPFLEENALVKKLQLEHLEKQKNTNQEKDE